MITPAATPRAAGDRFFRVAAGVLGPLLLAACATATPYQPLQDGEGYGEQAIEANRYLIHFAGNSLTPIETVEIYLLYRAAELTLARGYDYFITAESATTADTRYRQAFSGSFGYYWFPHAAAVIDTTLYPETEFDARANIVMLKGRKPDGDPHAFDARSVKANLESRVVRPGSG